MTTPTRPSFIAVFSKSQVAAGAATAADYAILFGLVEIFRVWYVLAVALGSVAGAVVNFIMNRHWSFEATHDRWHRQAVRYSVVSAISAILNSGGCWALTDLLAYHYVASVLIISALVGIFFNFPLHRHYVFR